jgi:hypothetical protein
VVCGFRGGCFVGALVFLFCFVCCCWVVAMHNNYLGSAFWVAGCFLVCFFDLFWLCGLPQADAGSECMPCCLLSFWRRLLSSDYTLSFSAGLVLGCFLFLGLIWGFFRGVKGRRKAGKGVKWRGIVGNGVVWLEKN